MINKQKYFKIQNGSIFRDIEEGRLTPSTEDGLVDSIIKEIKVHKLLNDDNTLSNIFYEDHTEDTDQEIIRLLEAVLAKLDILDDVQDRLEKAENEIAHAHTWMNFNDYPTHKDYPNGESERLSIGGRLIRNKLNKTYEPIINRMRLRHFDNRYHTWEDVPVSIKDLKDPQSRIITIEYDGDRMNTFHLIKTISPDNKQLFETVELLPNEVDDLLNGTYHE